MVNKIKGTLFLVFSVGVLLAQNNNNTADSTSSSDAKKKNEFVFKPTIGLGTGMFSFYGDIYSKHFQSPSVSRIGYDLNVSQRLTDYLQFNFYALFGRLGANENHAYNNRNLNFDAQIRVGGINLQYNFGNFLPKDRWASPWVSLGVESFEFLTKTDIYDAHGNKYYYWTDGTIRNMDESSPTAASAIIIHRDYTYESDVREMNLDGFGKYPERSWAIPVGAGAMFKINDYWDFKIGATMHFTFTDYIDGVTEKSKGNRVGNSKNDNFMMTSFSIHYNLGLNSDPDVKDDASFNDVDFFALDLEDADRDGVPDAKDSCQGTPEGVPVDLKGCPLDDDDDGVPNYKDDELNSPKGSYVDEKGVQMSDSLIAYRYNVYVDSTGAFAKVEYHDHNGNPYGVVTNQKEYTVEIGTFQKGVSPELMTKFLSINDVSTTNIDDSTTVYTAGKYSDLLSAEDRKKELIASGMTNARVVYKQNGKFYDAPKFDSHATGVVKNGNGNDNDTHGNDTHGNDTHGNDTHGNDTHGNGTHTSNDVGTGPINIPGVVLRVQLGAYHNRLSKNVFKGVSNLIEIKTDDGLYKYITGSFTNFDEAAKYKTDMLLKGYSGAFIAAYKDGKRISLKDAGATLPKKEDREVDDSSAVNGADKKLVTFKIQVGVFKNEPPEDKMALFAKVKDLKKETTSSGLTRYVTGSFNDYKSAEALKAELAKQGLTDAFIIALFNGDYISIQEAIELQK